MRVLLDEILSLETAAKHKQCSCSNCAHRTAAYPHWRSRRQQRLGLNDSHSVQCNCFKCQTGLQGELEYGDTAYHTYWRRRRQKRLGWPEREMAKLSDETGPYIGLVRAFLKGQRMAAQDLAQRRLEQKLPSRNEEGKKKYTVTKLTIGDKTFYGRSAYHDPNTLVVNPISARHAEADVFNKAARHPLTSVLGTLLVDRPLCIPCGVRGAVTSMARQVGLKKLVIIEPGGTSVINL